MANLIRSAKSGSDWTSHDLISYHIRLDVIEPLQFFGLQVLPQPLVAQELLNNVDADAMLQHQHVELIYLLDRAMTHARGEAAVDDFAVELFKVLGYVHRQRVACTRVDLPLLICGETRHAKTNVCIINSSQNDMLLLVQEDKKVHHKDPVDVQPQLVAEAVAAFNRNNKQRTILGLPPLVEMIMPGIIMVGTFPSFFKIPITRALSTHIANGTYPEEETLVTYCYPSVPRDQHKYSEGMKPLDNRQEILKCYQAFRAIVGI